MGTAPFPLPSRACPREDMAPPISGFSYFFHSDIHQSYSRSPLARLDSDGHVRTSHVLYMSNMSLRVSLANERSLKSVTQTSTQSSCSRFPFSRCGIVSAHFRWQGRRAAHECIQLWCAICCDQRGCMYMSCHNIAVDPLVHKEICEVYVNGG